MKLGKQVSCLMIILFFIFLTACSGDGAEESETESGNNAKEESALSDDKTEQTQEKEEMVEKEITLSAIGDILIHDRVYNDAKVDNGYDFNPMLKHVKAYLNNSTITFANQETMIGGEEIGLSGYPSFNSPYEVGDALKKVGVNVVSLANNHTLDHGDEAIQNAIEHWKNIDMTYTGSYKDQEDSTKIRVLETDEGITVAFLAYTYGTNGIPVPEGKEYLVNLIDKDVIADDVAKANRQADVTVLSLHFGKEYKRMPSKEQKNLVQFAADQGVHIVLGHHPHVLQPIEWVEGKKGNRTFVAYSLGNFLSGQYDFYRRIGGILKLTIKQSIKNGEEDIEIMEPKFMPTFVHDKNELDYRVIPMHQLPESKLEDAAEHYEKIKKHMSQWMPELEFVEE